jgi:hypothetical protein
MPTRNGDYKNGKNNAKAEAKFTRENNGSC